MQCIDGSSTGILFQRYVKLLANEDTLLPTQMFPRLPARATFVADTNFVSGTQKNVSDFVQKHFVSAANVCQFARARKHHEQQCVRNNVSSFASTFRKCNNAKNPAIFRFYLLPKEPSLTQRTRSCSKNLDRLL